MSDRRRDLFEAVMADPERHEHLIRLERVDTLEKGQQFISRVMANSGMDARRACKRQLMRELLASALFGRYHEYGPSWYTGERKLYAMQGYVDAHGRMPKEPVVVHYTGTLEPRLTPMRASLGLSGYIEGVIDIWAWPGSNLPQKLGLTASE